MVSTQHLNKPNLVSPSKKIRKCCKTHKSSWREIKSRLMAQKPLQNMTTRMEGRVLLRQRCLCVTVAVSRSVWTDGLSLWKDQLCDSPGQPGQLRPLGSWASCWGLPICQSVYLGLLSSLFYTQLYWKFGASQENIKSHASLNSVSWLKMFSHFLAWDLVFVPRWGSSR
jgi:hypothetical protein